MWKKLKRARKTLRNLVRYGESDPREFFIFEDKRLVYLVLSKVACTSIKTAIGRSYGIDSARDMDIHTSRHWKRMRGRIGKEHEEYYKFAFVRNPFDRLVSCYRDKVIYRGPDEVYRRPYFDKYLFDIPANISFAEFVRRIVRIPDYLADRHFKSQYSSLYRKGRPLVDYVGKFEHLARDWERLATRYGFETSLARKHVSSTKKGVRSDYREYYSAELAALVYERYKDDVEAFGYEQAYAELLEYCRKTSL